MTSCSVNRYGKGRRPRLAQFAIAGVVAIAGLAALIAAGDHADARGGASERSVKSIESRTAGVPIMAIVSLKSQRITVYDAQGWIVRAAVSTGQKGRETPAGIFSVIQKEAEHYSNLYDDAYMPHMQRLTWSGIALHGGPLPGYPASHGCIRMPFDFAEDLFGTTRLGLRVIVAPADVTPIEIAHPLLFSPKPGAGALASARTADAGEAARKADQARLAAVTAFREAAQARVPVRTAENLKRRAEAELASAEAAVASAAAAEAKEQAEAAKARASARIAELEAQWTAANAQLQPKLDALKDAREAAAAAEAERVGAAEAAREAARQLEPVSVLISRKTQRLYVRRGFEPMFDSPVTILDPDRPIGTHVITAVELIDNDSKIRWSVVSLEGDGPHGGAVEPHGRTTGTSAGGAEPTLKGPQGASAALDRIVIPQDALDRIPGITPRSSLIITDEALSPETGKGTDFVVLLSGQPQGGIKFRRRSPAVESGWRARDRLPYWRAPLVPFSTW
jgi:hypothetical protein